MIAKNHCLMKLRNNGNTIEINDRVMATPDEQDHESLVKKDRDLHLMQKALQQLNEEQRKCVILFYLEKKSYSEIVAQTGYSMLNVKSFIQNGKRNLRLLIQQQTPNDKSKNER
jgi:RNA polymerase sigma factor (sigma-70 family)